MRSRDSDVENGDLPLPTLAHGADPGNSVALAFAQGARDHEAGIVHPAAANPIHRVRHGDMGARTSTIQSIRSAQTREGALLPAEFRTLSIQVGDIREQERLGAAQKRSKKDQVAEKLGINAIRRKKDAKSKPAAPDADYFSQLSYHVTPAPDVALKLGVDPDQGLAGAEAQSRLSHDGPNAFKQKKPNYILKLLSWFFGGFGAILSLAVILFGISYKPLGNPDPQAYNLALAVLVLIVIVLQGCFNAAQDWSTTRVMNSIMGLLPADAVVLRDGQKVTVPAADLVKGDLVVLTQGARVPADMRLLSASADLAFDRAVLTGESEEVPAELNTDEDNFLESKAIAFLGSYVTSGSGVGIVVLTGSETVMGRINKLTNTGKEKTTNLQREVNRFIMIIVTLTVSLIVAMLIFWLCYLRKHHKGFLSTSGIITNLMSIVVAFIPEGVPMAVTLTLSLVARRMRDADVLPKSLATVETLGTVNVLLSDKTGTLTANKMTVTTVYVDEEVQPAAQALERAQSGGAYGTFERALVLCNDAFFETARETASDTESVESHNKKGDNSVEKQAAEPTPSAAPGRGTAKGNATDVAVLNYVASGDEYESTLAGYDRAFVLPFNSTNKFMMTACVQRGASARTVLFKGAPDILLTKCAMSNDARNKVVAAQEHMSAQGQRVILVASRLPIASKADPTRWWPSDEETRTLTDLDFLGLVGIVDPPKPEIPQTVADCRRSGCRFFMVTGDFVTTAAAIAEQCGIFTSREHVSRVADVPHDPDAEPPHALAIEGKEIPLITQAQWDVITRSEEVVFARTTPEQKLAILSEFQQRKYICAMTGDGTNDSPALRAADVGIAMVSGSDVALAAADLVLLGDFSSIIDGMRLGRLVFQNLQKVICYLLPAGSFSEDIPLIANVFFGLPLPLSSFQMIIICLLTDLACSLCMIFEKEEFDLLSLPPRKQSEHLVGARFYGQAYGFIGMMEMLSAFGMFFLYLKQDGGFNIGDLFLAYEKWGPGFHGYDGDQIEDFLNTAQSIYFVTLVIMQIGNLMTVRSKRMSILQSDPFFNPKRRNLTILIGPLVSIAIAILITEVHWFNSLFGTGHVPIRFWFLPVPLALGILLLDEVRKLIVRSAPSSFVAKLAW